jgi:hypothetical protein
MQEMISKSTPSTSSNGSKRTKKVSATLTIAKSERCLNKEKKRKRPSRRSSETCQAMTFYTLTAKIFTKKWVHLVPKNLVSGELTFSI